MALTNSQRQALFKEAKASTHKRLNLLITNDTAELLTTKAKSQKLSKSDYIATLITNEKPEPLISAKELKYLQDSLNTANTEISAQDKQIKDQLKQVKALKTRLNTANDKFEPTLNSIELKQYKDRLSGKLKDKDKQIKALKEQLKTTNAKPNYSQSKASPVGVKKLSPSRQIDKIITNKIGVSGGYVQTVAKEEYRKFAGLKENGKLGEHIERITQWLGTLSQEEKRNIVTIANARDKTQRAINKELQPQPKKLSQLETLINEKIGTNSTAAHTEAKRQYKKFANISPLILAVNIADMSKWLGTLSQEQKQDIKDKAQSAINKAKKQASKKAMLKLNKT